MSLIVKAPLVIVRNHDQGGRQEYLYEGSPLPSYVSAEDSKRLLEDGMVVKVGEDILLTPATTPAEVNATTGLAKAEPTGLVSVVEAKRK